MLKDGVVLENDEGKVTVNQHSFCELIKHLLVHYAGLSYAETSKLVDGSHLAEPIADAMSACLFSHEYPYFWAMDLYYGAMYWERGIRRSPRTWTPISALKTKSSAATISESPLNFKIPRSFRPRAALDIPPITRKNIIR